MLNHLYPAAPVSRSGLKAFQRQESIFAFLTLFLLALLLVFHKLFAPFLGTPSATLVFIVATGFTLKTFELIWLQRESSPRTAKAFTAFTWTSVVLNLLLAFLLSAACDCEDSPYFILLIVPVLEAAFCFPMITLAGVISAASFANFFSVWLYFHHHPSTETGGYLEAGIVSLMFATVGFVVWLLVRGLRRAESHLISHQGGSGQARERLSPKKDPASLGRLAGSGHESGSVAITARLLTCAEVRPPRRVPVSVADTANCVAEVCRVQASQKGILLRVQAQGALVASADPEQLRQALFHLTMNAVEASPPRGIIHLRAYRRDQRVLVDVENSGSPVSRARLAQIFELFFTAQERGAGLGLSIARKIARAHGGDLLLVTNEPQRVCFSLQLPSPNGKTAPCREANAQHSCG